jgi:hypothetical protein
VSFFDCEAIDRAQVERLLAIEFAEVSPATKDSALIARCRDQVVVWMGAAPGAVTLEKRLEVAPLPEEIRARVIALAGAELWRRLQRHPQAKPVVAAVAKTPSARPVAPPAEASHWRSTLGPDAKLYSRLRTIAAGGGLSVLRRSPHYFGEASLSANFGRTATDLGDVTLASASIALFVGKEWRLSPGSFRWGAGAGPTLFRIAGSNPASNVSASGFTHVLAGPIATAALTSSINRHTTLELRLEGGYHLARATARANGQTALDVRGFFLGARLSVGIE